MGYRLRLLISLSVDENDASFVFNQIKVLRCVIEIISFILIGGIAGVLAGLLGLGGGLVVVPLLAFILTYLDFPSSEVMRVAIATSLGTIVFTSLSSAYSHHRRGAVQWRVVWRLGLGLALGAFCASYAVDVMPALALKFIFVVYALLVAYQLYTGFEAMPSRVLPSSGRMFGLGGLFGGVSGLVGIGGGTLVVPFLVWCNLGIRQAVATSSACGFFIAVASVIGFVFFVQPEADLPEGSLGYLYLPALFVIGAVSVMCAPLGASWAHRVPADKLKQYFSFALLMMAGLLLVS